MKSEHFKYADILHLSRPPSAHPKMSMEARAAQFAPFAALAGHHEMVEEKERVTEPKQILTEDERSRLDETLQIALSRKHPYMKVTYFVSDPYKNGGCYVSRTDRLKSLDVQKHQLVLMEQGPIPIDDILHLEILDPDEMVFL